MILISPKSSDYVAATCQTTDAVGDVVHVFGSSVGGVLVVSKCDPSTFNKMPAIGVIVEKTSTTTCTVQRGGLLTLPYTPPFQTGKPTYVGIAGTVTTNKPTGGTYFLQTLGVATGPNTINLSPGSNVTRVL